MLCRGKNGDPSSSYLQVLQKLFRKQFLEHKIQSAEELAGKAAIRKQLFAQHRKRLAAAAHNEKKRNKRAEKGERTCRVVQKLVCDVV